MEGRGADPAQGQPNSGPPGQFKTQPCCLARHPFLHPLGALVASAARTHTRHSEAPGASRHVAPRAGSTQPHALPPSTGPRAAGICSVRDRATSTATCPRLLCAQSTSPSLCQHEGTQGPETWGRLPQGSGCWPRPPPHGSPFQCSRPRPHLLMFHPDWNQVGPCPAAGFWMEGAGGGPLGLQALGRTCGARLGPSDR